MKNYFILLFFTCTVFISGGITGKWWLNGGADAYAATDTLPIQELQELSEIFALIKRNYVEEIDSSELIKRAVRGMVASLDPHSSYFTEEQYDSFVGGLTNEEYGGVGIYIGVKDDWIEIISPIYDSPAYRAGLKSLDIILKIDGESTQGMPVEDAVDRMRGLADTVLQLDVLPEGGVVRQVELVRETIVTPSVLSALMDDGYGYLRITRFKNKTLEDLITGINGLYEQNGAPLKGIILDVRDNPGGYLLSGVGAAAVFLPQGATVVLEKGRDKTKVKSFVAHESHYDNMKHRAEIGKIPMVVLVNNGSASASEIVAGALQDHRRAVILGTRTYGKASVQSLVRLRSSKGASALRLTTARYYTPLDRNIQARGIEPDIEVNQLEVTEQEEGFIIREGDIRGHLGNAGEDNQPVEEEKKDNRPRFISEDDYQYDQAIQILKALAITAGVN